MGRTAAVAGARACAAARVRRAATASITATLRPLPGRREPSPARLMAARFAISVVSRSHLVSFSRDLPYGSERHCFVNFLDPIGSRHRKASLARSCRASALQSRQQPARKAGIRVHKMTTLSSFCTHAITRVEPRDARTRSRAPEQAFRDLWRVGVSGRRVHFE